MSADSPLQALLDRRVLALARYLPRAVDGDVRGVHQARVASRRLREAVPVLTAGLAGARRRAAVRRLRRLTRALGMVRELDVSLATLAEVKWSKGHTDAVGAVASHLQRLRAARREEMLGRLASLDRAKLAARLRRVGQTLAGSDREPAWRVALGRRLARRAKALGVALEDAGALYAPERLHAVRIAVKKLRYALELAGEARAGDTAALVRTLKKTQETLGRLHDLQVLMAHVRAVATDADVLRTASLDDLGALERAFETECRALHAWFVATTGRLTALTADVIGRIAPAVQARSGLSRPAPLKMALGAPGRRSAQR